MFEYMICALRNLGRKKFRTILTISGIAIGVASVIIIGVIGEGGKRAVIDQLDSLGVNGLNIQAQANMSTSNTTASMDQDDYKMCLDINGVQSATPVVMQSGMALLRDIEKPTLIWGIGSNSRNIISLNILHGKMISEKDISSHAQVCLVDDTFAKLVYKRSNIAGKKITLSTGGRTINLEIKGVVAAGSSLLYNLVGEYIPTFVYMPYTTAEDLRGTVGFDQIEIKTKANESNETIDSLGKHIANLLEENHSDKTFVATNMFKQKQKLSNLLTMVTLIISAIGAISLIVAGLGIMTVMTVSVNERTREIGIKKAIGAKKGMILLEFLFEALAISLMGGAAGIIFGMAVSYIASEIMKFTFSVQIQSLLTSAGFAVSIGVIFGVYPAIKAAKLKPVDALRRE